MIGELLNRITTALEMHGIPYMLTGSVASSLYGVPRATNDVDIVIAPQREQLLSLVQMFQRLRLTVAQEHAIAAFRDRGQFNVIDFPSGLKVDLIVRKDREFSVTEFDRRDTYEVKGMRLTIASPEDVLIAKLEWAKLATRNGRSSMQPAFSRCKATPSISGTSRHGSRPWTFGSSGARRGKR